MKPDLLTDLARGLLSDLTAPEEEAQAARRALADAKLALAAARARLAFAQSPDDPDHSAAREAYERATERYAAAAVLAMEKARR